MRKVTFGGANSLDDYIARKDEGIDWILWGDEAAAYCASHLQIVDAVREGVPVLDCPLTGDRWVCFPSDAEIPSIRLPAAVKIPAALLAETEFERPGIYL